MLQSFVDIQIQIVCAHLMIKLSSSTCLEIPIICNMSLNVLNEVLVLNDLKFINLKKITFTAYTHYCVQCIDLTCRQSNIFASQAMLYTVYAMALCLCVCLSVTSRSSTNMAKHRNINNAV